MAKDTTAYAGAMKELREAHARMKERAPGNPAVAIPLEHIITYRGEDGESRAVIPVEQVIYLADEVLRSAR